MPIDSDVEENNNGCVIALKCSAGKHCVLASTWRFVWRLNPSGPTTFVGHDETEFTQEQIIESKKRKEGAVKVNQSSLVCSLIFGSVDDVFGSRAQSQPSRLLFICLIGLREVHSFPPLRTSSGQSEAACGQCGRLVHKQQQTRLPRKMRACKHACRVKPV